MTRISTYRMYESGTSYCLYCGTRKPHPQNWCCIEDEFWPKLLSVELIATYLREAWESG